MLLDLAVVLPSGSDTLSSIAQIQPPSRSAVYASCYRSPRSPGQVAGRASCQTVLFEGEALQKENNYNNSDHTKQSTYVHNATNVEGFSK